MQGDGFPPFARTDEVKTSAQDFIARIPSTISDQLALFEALSRGLNFPSYFGRNWDALDECLSDLNWIKQRRVVLIHDAAPHLSRHDLVTYLSILRDAILCLRSPQDYDEPSEFTPRELIVAFPRDAASRIAQAWNGVKPSDYS